MRTPLTADTPLDIEARQIDAWRRMSPADKAAIVAASNRVARDMMLAGIRHRHPDADEREVFLRAAIIQLGPDLAIAAYPDSAPYLRQ